MKMQLIAIQTRITDQGSLELANCEKVSGKKERVS